MVIPPCNRIDNQNGKVARARALSLSVHHLYKVVPAGAHADFNLARILVDNSVERQVDVDLRKAINDAKRAGDDVQRTSVFFGNKPP